MLYENIVILSTAFLINIEAMESNLGQHTDWRSFHVLNIC